MKRFYPALLIALCFSIPQAHADDDDGGPLYSYRPSDPQIQIGGRGGGVVSKSSQPTTPGSGAGGGLEIAVKVGDQDRSAGNNDPTFQAKASGQFTGARENAQVTGDLTARFVPIRPSEYSQLKVTPILESQSKITPGMAIVAATGVNGIGPHFDFYRGTASLIAQPLLLVQNRVTGNWEWAAGASALADFQLTDWLRLEGRVQAGASLPGERNGDTALQFVAANLTGQYQLGENYYLGAEVSAEHLHSKSLPAGGGPVQSDSINALTAVATAGATF